MSVEVDQFEQGIVTVVLNNPSRRNALTRTMVGQLAELWPRLSSDKAVRVVVLRGAGQQAFSAGADLTAGLDQIPEIDDLVERALLKTDFIAQPLIAAISGACVAGGLELALAADIRIASDHATFGLPEVRWGIMPSGGAAMKLLDQIGYTQAMNMLLSGDLITAVEAERIGLVTSLAPADAVFERAYGLARRIAGNSPVAVQAAKKAALAHRAEGYRQRESLERALVAEVRASGHSRLGVQAFLNKQVPVYD